jgi:hypothetical protein
MAFGLRRGGGDRLKALLARDLQAVSTRLARSEETHNSNGGEMDLRPLIQDLFEKTPTHDIESLKDRGIDADGFWEEEVRPNWNGLNQGERASKVQSFARFANAVGDEYLGGMGAVVRTKLLVLAWAYDTTYGEHLTRQLARKPQRFGTLELTAVR